MYKYKRNSQLANIKEGCYTDFHNWFLMVVQVTSTTVYIILDIVIVPGTGNFWPNYHYIQYILYIYSLQSMHAYCYYEYYIQKLPECKK